MVVLKPLYLDTARLGQMSPRACRASVDFSRFAAEFGSDPYLTELLANGFQSWPGWLQEQFAGLCDWQGIAGLKDCFRQLTQSTWDTSVAVASRSGSLMRVASRLMSGHCRNVLITDLTWPTYGEILESEKQQGFRTTVCNVRQSLLRDCMTSNELIRLLTTTYIENQCDGLFLPLIDNLGVKLPVPRIVAAIEKTAKVRFVTVDGSQALGQIPLELHANYCDFLVAGCHKWLRAYSPMGVGLFGMRSDPGDIKQALHQWLDQGTVDDPLLRFTNELESAGLKPFGETVHIAPLFNANAAIVDALEPRIAPIHTVCDSIEQTEVFHLWRRLLPQTDMQSGATVFESRRESTRRLPAEAIRKRFHRNGVVVSAYDNGLIRVSEPQVEMQDSDWHQLVFGFNNVPLEFHYSCR